MITKNLKGYLIYCIIMIIGLLQFSCDNKKTQRGYEYFPDMVNSIPYDTYSENPNTVDGKTAQHAVVGTIPRHMVPYTYPNTSEGLKMAGKELENPFQVNRSNIKRGEVEYNVFCANCHGLTGKGDGNLYTSGKYKSEPVSFMTPEMLKKPDGEYFHTITVGSAVMGSFGSLIRPQDRWKIVLYIKNKLPKAGKSK
ncbi:MAG: c-type cytochrome [Flavobacteriaceae bacterium]|nr:c-type cytochrome [Flavobacteriaceae bacterium]